MFFGEVSLRSFETPRPSRSGSHGFKRIKPKGKLSLSSGPFQVLWGNESLSSAIAARINFSLDLKRALSDERGIIDYTISDVLSKIQLDHYYDNDDTSFAERYYNAGAIANEFRAKNSSRVT